MLADQRNDVRMAQGLGNALELQPELPIVDAERGIDGQHELDRDRDLSGRARRLAQTCGKPHR